MRIHNLTTKLTTRRELRKAATPQEIILWSRLRRKDLGCKFRRQHSIGRYIVDFYCPTYKLIVELDGNQHNEEDRKEYDAERTRYFKDLGLTVVRFWNGEVNKNLEGVMIKIKEYLR
ncbi:MAG: endonuclease domain-containing protein [Parcubacteria group bacterium]